MRKRGRLSSFSVSLDLLIDPASHVKVERRTEPLGKVIRRGNKMLMMLAALALVPQTAPSPFVDDPESLTSRAERYCIDPDGDHRLTWHRAEQDGFTLLSNAEYARLRLPGTGGLRAFSKTEHGIEYRILTAAHSETGPSGIAYFRRCWVSSSQYSIDDANRELRDLLGFRHFRAKNTFVYAWIPQTDGTLRPVSRRIYMRSSLRMAAEQGLRQVSAKQYEDQVFISYASPRDRAIYRDFDWAGPEPVVDPR